MIKDITAWKNGCVVNAVPGPPLWVGQRVLPHLGRKSQGLGKGLPETDGLHQVKGPE